MSYEANILPLMGYWKELSSLNVWPVIVRAHLLYEKPWAFWGQFFKNKDWMLIKWMNFNFFSTGYFRLVGLTTLLSFTHLFLSLNKKIPCTTGPDSWMKDLFLGLWSEWWNNWTLFISDVHTEAVQAALAKHKERKMAVPMPSKRRSLVVQTSMDAYTPPG